MGSINIANSDIGGDVFVNFASTEGEWMAILDGNAAMVSSDAFNRMYAMDTGMSGMTLDVPNHFERPDGRDPCPWCGAQFYPNKFHPGNCGECGGPKHG